MTDIPEEDKELEEHLKTIDEQHELDEEIEKEAEKLDNSDRKSVV